MSDASWQGGWASPQAPERAATAPPKPTPSPVFIGDCTTQWGGRPMLLLLAEAWERRGEG